MANDLAVDGGCRSSRRVPYEGLITSAYRLIIEVLLCCGSQHAVRWCCVHGPRVAPPSVKQSPSPHLHPRVGWELFTCFPAWDEYLGYKTSCLSRNTKMRQLFIRAMYASIESYRKKAGTDASPTTDSCAYVTRFDGTVVDVTRIP
ncbi:hypothetical protein MRX96_000510 [Rhipicephalus microplus]